MELLIALAVSCTASTTLVRAEDPVVKPSDFSTLANADYPQTLKLTNTLEIPDGPNGMINLPLYCAADFPVRAVRVDVKGLFHEHASDVKMTVRYGSLVARLVGGDVVTNDGLALEGNRGGALTFGEPKEHPHPNSQAGAQSGMYAEVNPVVGRGYDYGFQDPISSNVAFGRPAWQSTTFQHRVATFATDGDVSGVVEDNTIAHTAGHHDPNPWWQVDLGRVQDLGHVRFWNIEPSCNLREVQVVTVTGAVVVEGTFRLRVTLRAGDQGEYIGRSRGMVAFNTTDIRYDAVPMIADEDPRLAKGAYNGSAPGESVQAKLQAAHPWIGAVRVSRGYGTHDRNADPTTVNAADNPYRQQLHQDSPDGKRVTAYSWTVTFGAHQGDIPEMDVVHTDFRTPDPGTAVDDARLGNRDQDNQDANVTVATLTDGAHHSRRGEGWYSKCSDSDFHTRSIKSRLFPCWVMVLSEDIGNMTLFDARLAAAAQPDGYWRRFPITQRETLVALPPGVRGRYV